jgi:hypothetical protein
MMPSTVFRRWAYAYGIRHVPRFVIHAPDYTYLSSGVRCLHLLCDRLNELGVSAAITARVAKPGTNTPRINADVISAYPALFDRSIVVYPEIYAGNPLGAKNVVRYLLNAPGFFTGVGVEAFGKRDYYLHFAEEFRPPGVASRPLRLSVVDTSIFTPPPPSTPRDGFLVYGVRYRPDTTTFPSWVDRVTMICRETPRDPSTLAKLYQTSRAMIVGERTAAVAEALHCHCPVVLVPHDGFAHEPVLDFHRGYGTVLGFDQSELARAALSVSAMPARYAAREGDVNRKILEFVADAERYFGLSGAAQTAG